ERRQVESGRQSHQARLRRGHRVLATDLEEATRATVNRAGSRVGAQPSCAQICTGPAQTQAVAAATRVATWTSTATACGCGAACGCGREGRAQLRRRQFRPA